MKTTAETKPFPWKCQNCGRIAVRREIVTYPVDIEYDGRVYSITIKGLNAPQCRECHGVFPDAEANCQITQEFRRQAGLLTQHQIRRNREQLGLTQKQLAKTLGFAEATVSRWETGAQIQQRSLDNLLRIYFGFPGVRKALAAEGCLQRLDLVTDDQSPQVSIRLAESHASLESQPLPPTT